MSMDKKDLNRLAAKLLDYVEILKAMEDVTSDRAERRVKIKKKLPIMNGITAGEIVKKINEKRRYCDFTIKKLRSRFRDSGVERLQSIASDEDIVSDKKTVAQLREKKDTLQLEVFEAFTAQHDEIFRNRRRGSPDLGDRCINQGLPGR